MKPMLETNKFVSSTEWARNFSKYLEKVKQGGELYVIKNSKPEAVVLDVEEYNRLVKLAELVEDVEISAMIEKRKNSKVRYSLSEVIKKLGLTEEELDDENNTP